MKTTEYGLPGAVNEFGIEKPAKDVDYSHSPGAILSGTKPPVSDSDLKEMVRDFHRIKGHMPSKVFIAEPAGHYKARGVTVPLLGSVVLDFEYGATETHVE